MHGKNNSKSDDLHASMTALVARASDNGSHDNITAIGMRK